MEKLLSLNWQYWGLQTLAMLLTALLLPKLKVTSPLGAFLTVVALSFVNSKVWDAALFFHIPDHFSVQALSLLVANGIIFWILVKLLPGIEIQGIMTAFVAPVIFTVCSLFIAHYGAEINWTNVLNGIFEAVTTLRNLFLDGVGTEGSPVSNAFS